MCILSGGIFFAFIYFNIRKKVENKIMLTTPFNKIDNKRYLLYFFKVLFENIRILDESEEERCFIVG